ncbi:MAG: dTDP-4-dehydrorhamnose 3,5-epimerase [Eubacteriales bacterium]|nr:dTDP-4-dehydrorhamnose 3,5-epimerase [Eubacteriales bacterium]
MARFKKVETNIKDVIIIENEPFFDNRGYFYETYNKKEYEQIGIKKEFIQDNQSMSSKGVLRGLHFQINFPQAKLLRCIYGEVFDVCVDLRKGSSTFGQYVSTILSEKNHKEFYIPEGFAHGFLVLSDKAVFSYKVTDYYHSNDEGGIIWNDQDINIDWPIQNDFILSFSNKDTKWGSFKEYLKNYN